MEKENTNCTNEIKVDDSSTSINKNNKNNRPKIGLGIIVIDENNKILLGKRKDCLKYGIPGGYLEGFETWREGASRELYEEVGLNIEINKIHPLIVYDAMNKKEYYHNVAIVLITKINSKEKYSNNEIVNKEPDKCENWEFWEIDELYRNKEQLFFPNKIFIENFPHIFNKEFLNKFIEKKESNVNDVSFQILDNNLDFCAEKI